MSETNHNNSKEETFGAPRSPLPTQHKEDLRFNVWVEHEMQRLVDLAKPELAGRLKDFTQLMLPWLKTVLAGLQRFQNDIPTINTFAQQVNALCTGSNEAVLSTVKGAELLEGNITKLMNALTNTVINVQHVYESADALYEVPSSFLDKKEFDRMTGIRAPEIKLGPTEDRYAVLSGLKSSHEVGSEILGEAQPPVPEEFLSSVISEDAALGSFSMVPSEFKPLTPDPEVQVEKVEQSVEQKDFPDLIAGPTPEETYQADIEHSKVMDETKERVKNVEALVKQWLHGNGNDE